MNLAELLREESRWTYTENGADALNTTGGALVDMFSSLPAMRGRDPQAMIRLFELAWKENPLFALRCLFQLRDVRGGEGERDAFRILLHWAARTREDAIRANLPLIPFYGRFDDCYALLDTPVEHDMWALLRAQLARDRQDMAAGQPVSLLAKWLKKANSRHADTRALGRYTAGKLGLSEYEYNRLTARLRRYMDVAEVRMSAREWAAIRYEGVPGRAMLIYRNAFTRHDKARFSAYLEAVASGSAAIHSGTLYPYDIIEKILYRNEQSPVLEAQWKALPDYVGGGSDILVMADVSGSMYGRPMASSIGLALYFAERNRGAYRNLFMTFSSRPQIVNLQGDTLWEKVAFIAKSQWGMNTNLISAMQRVLDIAVREKLPQSALPRALVVITDMEFDQANAPMRNRRTYSEHIKAMFAEKGYAAPCLVFWNVSARHYVFHADAAEEGVVLVAGHSAGMFENLIAFLSDGTVITPRNMMYDVLSGERYAPVQLPDDAETRRWADAAREMYAR